MDTFAYEWKDVSAEASSSCAWLDALYNQCLSKGAYCSCAGSSSHGPILAMSRPRPRQLAQQDLHPPPQNEPLTNIDAPPPLTDSHTL